jgi:predicted DNA-binding transcriptional regulator AlpA
VTHGNVSRDAATETSAALLSATGDCYLPAIEVKYRYHKSEMTLWRWVRDPRLKFPPPVKIGYLNHWRLSDLLAWEAERAAETQRQPDAAA